ncbi:MAG: 50S ribosomal protein L15 [Gammaproteobacteria bacterium]|nr:50S ribosomal protein L15 [Gammaproteobacteria bacterium]
MRLNTLKPAPGAKREGVRLGRGIGSGKGKTGGRGHKGQTSRTGSSIPVGFEGGQMPIARRMPKFGFSSKIGRATAEVRLNELNKIEGDTVNLETLLAADVIKAGITRVKIFLSGELKKAVTVKGVGVTKGAKAAIEKAGGKVEV